MRNPPTDFRDSRRLAPWWMCALMLLIAAFFGYVISQSHGKPANGDVFTRFLIPPYCVWIYLVLGCLFNRQTIRGTVAGVRVSTGPIRMGMNEFIPREQIAFCYHFTVLGSADDAGSDDKPFVVGHVAGLETREGRQIVLTEASRDFAATRDFATALATALNPLHTDEPIEVRTLLDPRRDPVGKNHAWWWGGIWAAAVVAGAVWEFVQRWGHG